MYLKADKKPGYKLKKERVTVLLCANMTGKDKLIFLVIGRYQNPRCFKQVKTCLADIPQM